MDANILFPRSLPNDPFKLRQYLLCPEMRGLRSSASVAGIVGHLRTHISPANAILRPKIHNPPAFSRSFISWLKSKPKLPPKPTAPQVVLAADDLFHPLSQSPIPSLRKRAEAVTNLAPCPVCQNLHEPQRPQQFECPDCGWPTHCTELHWKEDLQHKVYCSRLKEVNEDEHDLRSGRNMAEFDMPGASRVLLIRVAQWALNSLARRSPGIRGSYLVCQLGYILVHARLCVDGFRAFKATRKQASHLSHNYRLFIARKQWVYDSKPAGYSGRS